MRVPARGPLVLSFSPKEGFSVKCETLVSQPEIDDCCQLLWKLQFFVKCGPASDGCRFWSRSSFFPVFFHIAANVSIATCGWCSLSISATDYNKPYKRMRRAIVALMTMKECPTLCGMRPGLNSKDCRTSRTKLRRKCWLSRWSNLDGVSRRTISGTLSARLAGCGLIVCVIQIGCSSYIANSDYALRR